MLCHISLVFTTGMIKDFMQVPVVLSSRAAVRRLIDDAWFELVDLDWEALKVCLLLSVFLCYLTF